MTIHSEHPFLPPEGERSPVRRFRGRLPAPVTVWTSGTGDAKPAGLTVSSLLISDGDPSELIGLIDPDSDLADAIARHGTIAVSLLNRSDHALAEAFAGTAPAPGGPFRLASWTATDWGPVLTATSAWLGARVQDQPAPAGWALLVRAVIERVELSQPSEDPLAHLRGRYGSVS
ncbi:flavin reductase family protein [Microlunatus speluncae]|uniref:flavin reductase family protein n=1 Tax=Microlunatus speluncae TaxID=2594267 RepID=UPI0012665030|nr:flavin reductase family protein [Microlunatus speluncae]